MTKAEIEYYTKGLNFVENNKIFVYKYIDLQGGLELINNQTFKFSHPKDFNDPFDLYEPLIDFSKHDTIDNYYPNRAAKREIQNMSIKKKIEGLKHSWRRQRMNIGISCFSKTYKEILMWSHYADKHEGICVGFMVDAMRLLNDGFLAFAVEYKDNFIALPYSDLDIKVREKSLMQYLSLKADFWKYEQEIRFISFDYFLKYKNVFFDFSKYANIVEVYFGLKTKKENKKKCIKLFSKNNLPVFYDMAPIDNRFEIERKLPVPNDLL